MSTLSRTAALPAAIALLALAPFLGKAFTIDDAFFLYEARHALADPLHPTAFDMTWNASIPERVSTIMPSGPVAAWLLLPSIAAGGDERTAHAVSLVLLVVAALGQVALARRLGLSPGWATASGVLLVTTPVVLGMAGTAMPDVPAMAFGILGVERLLAWRELGGWHRAAVGAVLLALAALTRSHLVALLVLGPLLLAGDALLDRGRVRAVARFLWPSGIAAALSAAVLVATRDPRPGGGGLAASMAELSQLGNAPFNAFCFAIHWVLATAFALAWLALRARAVARRWWLLAAVCAVLALMRWIEAGASATWWAVPIAALGAFALLDVLVDALERRDGVQLVLGAWLLLPLPAAIYTHFPSKYLVASIPAACLLLALRARAAPAAGRWVVTAAAAAGLLLGTAILRADAALGEVARTGIRTLVTPQVVAGRTLWYDGHWGFHWYAEQAGARSWDATPDQPRPGDLILTNENRPFPLDEGPYRALVHVGRYEDRRPGGRVMSFEAGAGFYSNGWGFLPWAWGDDVIDAIDLWRAPGGPP